MRGLVTRVQRLERENRYLRQHRDKARTERDRARDTARWLHGLLLANGIDPVKNRLRSVA